MIIEMLLFIVCVVVGLALLVWSADVFVEGSVFISKFYGMSPLLIGMLVIGFGTSAPEIFVSIISSIQGNSGLAIGNAYGSNIANSSLILGVTALMIPVVVSSQVLKIQMPILIAVMFFSAGLLSDLNMTRLEAFGLLVVFVLYFLWSFAQSKKSKKDTLADETLRELKEVKGSKKSGFIKLFSGLVFLVVSSRMLVWGAVGVARYFNVDDVVIGLTVVAIGTSLPELASSISAAKKGESDMAMGNILGSNLFNTLFVVGVSGLIKPISITKEILHRDVSAMIFLSVLMLLFSFSKGHVSAIGRKKGVVLLLCFVVYMFYVLKDS